MSVQDTRTYRISLKKASGTCTVDLHKRNDVRTNKNWQTKGALRFSEHWKFPKNENYIFKILLSAWTCKNNFYINFFRCFVLFSFYLSENLLNQLINSEARILDYDKFYFLYYQNVWNCTHTVRRHNSSPLQ